MFSGRLNAPIHFSYQKIAEKISNKNARFKKYIFFSINGNFKVNAIERKKADDALNSSSSNHYMALYKGSKYKGLYEVEQLEDILRIIKIQGTGPKGKIVVPQTKKLML